MINFKYLIDLIKSWFEIPCFQFSIGLLVGYLIVKLNLFAAKVNNK